MTTSSTSAFIWPSKSRTSRTAKAEPLFWHMSCSEPPPAEAAFIALVPGSDAVVHAVSLPPALKGKAREDVAIRQVRDRLDAQSGSLVILPICLSGSKDDWSSVLVARAEDVRAWRCRLGAAEARCQAILPDYLALPGAHGLWTVATISESGCTTVRVRLGLTDGFTAEAELAALTLARARSTRPPPDVILRLGLPEPRIDGALDGLPLVHSRQSLPKRQASAGVIQQGEETLDLAADPHRQGPALARRLRQLTLPILLITVGVLSWISSLEIEARQHLALANALRDELNAVVRRDFLPSGPIVDLRVQVAREIERFQTISSTRGGGLLVKFRQISNVLASQDDLKVISVVLREGEGISFDVNVPNFTALDNAMESLRAATPEIRLIRSTTDTETSVSGSFFLSLEDSND